MSTLVVMKVVGNLTMRKIQTILKEVFRTQLSLGKINNTLKDVSDIMLPIYLEMLDNVKLADVVNADETFYRLSQPPNPRKRVSVWGFACAVKSKDLIVFKIGTRSKYMLELVLGEFSGILGSDFYGAYRSFVKSCPNALAQYCMAYVKIYISHVMERSVI
jgi:hypothetical protein